MAGQVRGQSLAVAQAERKSTWFLAAGLRLGVELDIDTTWAFSGRIDSLAVPTRTTLQIDGEPLWVSPTFSAAAGIGIRAQFR